MHHGDDVKDFEKSNRVMTVSFHQYGKDFFPGTGKIDDVGKEGSTYRSLNVRADEQFVVLQYHTITWIRKQKDKIVIFNCSTSTIHKHYNITSTLS